ncbi:hypothetical protein LguiA_021030 [Lonicera macranthoides]
MCRILETDAFHDLAPISILQVLCRLTICNIECPQINKYVTLSYEDGSPPPL